MLELAAVPVSGLAMKRHSFVRGLLTATTLVTGVLLLGSTSASAQNAPAQPVTASADLKSHTTTDRPPVFSKARFTCQDEGAVVVTKLSNPNATVQQYMVGIHGGDIYYDYVVTLAARGAESVEFGGLPDNTYQFQAQNPDGDIVARTRVRVQCDVTPPTGTPTATPTGTPTAPPSETPTTSPTTGPSSATTAVPSTPVDVPTAVEAGLPGPVAQDDSNHGRTIVGASLMAAVGLMIGLASLLVRRRRGLHQS
ncbi:hypothetical protein EV652_11891 [Kribbella steppae]|uniref:LPXTG-motif cell wall-anchored protein n=1 Tax=Kribbella steppae TaxID=2512223 RepID=A0A4R2H106_9ACTN|nr:hypothetical protein [Kribbella steppae]TCO17263.1 hypothetical protein EV652_11891 [Kribbella steppae]